MGVRRVFGSVARLYALPLSPSLTIESTSNNAGRIRTSATPIKPQISCPVSEAKPFSQKIPERGRAGHPHQWVFSSSGDEKLPDRRKPPEQVAKYLFRRVLGVLVENVDANAPSQVCMQVGPERVGRWLAVDSVLLRKLSHLGRRLCVTHNPQRVFDHVTRTTVLDDIVLAV